ncbi:MAG: CHAT domain-containing protein [Phaeodactylibacter sp.]|nr:CHAT domain-containing protein [Phaeodactylibacter sp.]
MMRLNGLLTLLWMTPTFLFGQAEPGAAPSAYQALEMADSCIRSEDYLAARQLYLEALPYFTEKEDYQQQSYIYLWLSETSYYTKGIQQAMKEAQYSRLLAESCLRPDTLSFYCTILQNLGLFYSVQSDFGRQMDYYLQSLDAALQYHGENSARAADAYMSVGAAFGRRGRWSECISYTENSLKIARKVDYPEGIVSALLNLSYSFAEQEDFEKAIQHQKQALVINTRLEERVRGLNNLGTLYNDIGEYAAALENLHSALQLRRTGYLSDGGIFSTLLNITYAHSESGRLDSATYYLETAIHGLLRRGKETERDLLQIAYNYKGKLLLVEGSPEAAEQATREALALRGNWRGINSSSFMLLGQTLLEQERYEEALDAAQKGLQWAAPGFDAANPMVNPPWETLESIAQARGLLKLKGDILRERGLASEEQNLLLASLSAFQQGDSLVMWLRNTYQSRLSRDLIAANANELYAGALHTLYHLYQQTGDTLFFDQALAFSEKNKALSVLENLNQLYARSFSGVPDAVVEAERQLLEEIEFYSNLVKRNRGYEADSLLAAWEGLIFEKRLQQDSLLNRIETQYPRYYQMKHGFQLSAVGPLQQELLSPGETLLEYFWGDDVLFVFLLTREKRQFFCLPAHQLADRILAVCQAVVRREPAFYQLSHELYKTLIQPLEPYIEGSKLAIVPDNILARLPFELLLYEPVSGEGLLQAQHAYLLKKYAIRNLFSANVALQARHQTAMTPANRAILALAPSFDAETASVESSGFANLPGARSELDSLEAAYQGLFLRGEDATEANFRKYCRSYGIYHIATHTEIDQRLPSASHFLMKEGAGEDGRLYVYELYNMRLDADLAVLSSCNTGTGEIKAGEGSASLAHAFAYAGCSDIVMSLWPVKDRTTPVLVKRYYDNMAAGMDRCEALRQAKLYYLEYDELFAHPYYWSGFLYMGSRAPLSLKRNWNLPRWPFMLLACFLALGLIFVLIRRGTL